MPGRGPGRWRGGWRAGHERGRGAAPAEHHARPSIRPPRRTWRAASRPRSTTSMGYVVRRGEALGIATPANRVLQVLVKMLETHWSQEMTQRKVALVTGSGTGVGAAAALMLAQRGYDLLINYSRSEQEAERSAAACRDGGRRRVGAARRRCAGRRLPGDGAGRSGSLGPHRRTGQQRGHFGVRRGSAAGMPWMPTCSTASWA